MVSTPETAVKMRGVFKVSRVGFTQPFTMGSLEGGVDSTHPSHKALRSPLCPMRVIWEPQGRLLTYKLPCGKEL